MTTPSPKRIGLGVFEAGSPQIGGTVTWSHPRSRGTEFRNIHYWMEMAKLLDDADFDFLFFAGGSFGYSTFKGELSTALVRGGFNFGIDGAYIIPALAAVTEKLGFVVTSTTGADHPMHTVRKFATLDAVTNGRIGWNIVTGASQNVMSEVLGMTEMVPHAERYAAADEYVDLALEYWEGGNEDDVMPMDAETGVFADASKMHKIVHDGTYYRSTGYHTQPPTPQRTPLLFQAGTSDPGRALAARQAEGVFVQGTTHERTAEAVADIRAKAAANGRDPQSIKVFVGVTLITGKDDEEAAQRRREFEEMQDDEVTAHYYSGNTGVDLSALDPTKTLLEQDYGYEKAGQMGKSNIERFLGGNGRPAPTVREILDELRPRGTRGFAITGGPESAADQIEALIEATDLDGIMIEAVFDIASMQDFIEHVQPVLRARGRLDPAPTGETFRERMLGAGPHLADTHHAAAYRPTPGA
jgi:long-chain alkane monooxygenase